MAVSEIPKNVGKNILLGFLIIGGGLLLISYANKKLNLTGRFVSGAQAIGSSIGQGIGAGTAEVGVGVAEGFSNVAARGAAELTGAIKQFQEFVSGKPGIPQTAAATPGPPTTPLPPSSRPVPTPPTFTPIAGLAFKGPAGQRIDVRQVTPGEPLPRPTPHVLALQSVNDLYKGTITYATRPTRTVTGSSALFARIASNVSRK